MATLDQLPPDRRAIIELVLERGQSYEDLSGALGMPEARVREHAREALASLAPRSAERVDPQWRGQVADYVLGQQSGPQSKATRSHLQGSEAARTWAMSVLDSIGHLYPGGAAPAIPAGGRSSDGGEPATERGAEHSGTAAAAGAATGAGAGTAATRSAEESGPSTADGRSSSSSKTGTLRPLSSEAKRLVRRRRVIAGAAGLVVVALIVLLATGAFGGGEDEPADAGETADAAATDPQVTAQIDLQPVGNGGGNAAGVGLIAEREGQNVLVSQGRLPTPGRGEQYVFWLYNSPDDSVAVGTPQIDQGGNYQVVAPLPENYQDYESVDVSVQRRSVQSDRRNHSGNSILRGSITVAEGGGVPLPEAPTAPGAPTAPEGAVPPGGAVPPEGGQLPDPGSLPTVPEGG